MHDGQFYEDTEYSRLQAPSVMSQWLGPLWIHLTWTSDWSIVTPLLREDHEYTEQSDYQSVQVKRIRIHSGYPGIDSRLQTNFCHPPVLGVACSIPER